jgi:tRNA nucleotidyltransferase (CCA-adding enzyme)
MRKATVAETLRALPKHTAHLVHAVLGAADERLMAVYLVGGPVRDLLLQRGVGDADLVVEGREGEGAAELARAAAPLGARVTSHDRFGTVSLQHAKASVDLATVRGESYAHDGALPTVRAGSLEEDLRRRDFTVNAMALPLSEVARSRHSGLVDLESGLRDLEERRLRVLHARSFHDDPTRALRAARLAPRLGFTLTRGSRSALRDALRDGACGRVSGDRLRRDRVSGDRLRREVIKLFEDARQGLDPARALRLLSDWHVLGALEPGLSLAREAAPALRRMGRTIASPPWQAGRWRPWVSGLAVWLAPLEPGLRRRTLRRFAVRGAVATRIGNFPRARDAWLRSLERARGRGAIDSVLGELDDDALHALLAGAPQAVRRRIVRYASEDRSRRVPVNGDDLTQVGLTGPAVGRALLRIRVAYLDGAVKTREEALALARELVARRGAGGPKKAAKPARK